MQIRAYEDEGAEIAGDAQAGLGDNAEDADHADQRRDGD